MKECKILYFDDNHGLNQRVTQGSGYVSCEEFIDAESIINKYINNGFSVKNISAASDRYPPSIVVYLERTT